VEEVLNPCWAVGRRVIPRLCSERLCLRPCVPDDIPQIAALAGDARIARMTSLVPHPYTKDDAEAWIATHAQSYENGSGPAWAVTRKDDAQLVGCIGITINRRDQVGSLGYWTGVPFWRQGYTLEAASAAVSWARAQKLPRLSASVLADNIASQRILLHTGFSKEGTLRADALRDGNRIDVYCYGLVFTTDEARASLQ
jgi:RimJ/RimL family protein N-acetyltransferase